jgi:hypothetical protein
MNTETWASIGTMIATLTFIVPGLVYSWYASSS